MQCIGLFVSSSLGVWLLGLTLVACSSSQPSPSIAESPDSAATHSAAGHAAGAPHASQAGAGGGTDPQQAPRAGTGSMQPAASGASAPAQCARPYTTALRAKLEMSWPDTIGLVAGRGALTFWAKFKHTPAADGGEKIENMPCGVALPVVTTTPLLAGIQLANEVPTASFDRPSMPHFNGHSTWQAGLLVTTPGVIMLGVRLSDPRGAWPARSALVPLDDDGDGEPGITAIPKNGGGFALPPADIGQTEHADRVYIAARVSFEFTAARAGCSQRVDGAVNPIAFDYAIVGCHALNGADCTKDNANLLGNNSPKFTLGSRGDWTSLPVDETATCEDVLAALPAE
jgi:hypothetical protein